jgi:hypothetical protein
VESTHGSWPRIYGDWNGEDSAIVGATLGITPMKGSKMLQFLGTSFNGGGSGNSCQVYQLIDFSSYKSLVTSGSAIVMTYGYVNRVAGDSQMDAEMSIIVMAYDGTPGTFPFRWAANGYDSTLTYSVEWVFADSIADTWERIDVELNIPTDATFLVINLNAMENIHNDSSLEFDGHFIDIISMQVTPEPTTVLLLSMGFAGIIGRKKTKV